MFDARGKLADLLDEVAKQGGKCAEHFAFCLGFHFQGEPDDDQFRAHIARFAEGRGADVVGGPVGGAMTELACRSLGHSGRHHAIGFASGDIPSLRVNLALVKVASLAGVDVGQFLARQPDRAEELRQMLRIWWEQGLLRVPIAVTFPFDRFTEAMNMASSRETMGRVVLRINA